MNTSGRKQAVGEQAALAFSSSLWIISVIALLTVLAVVYMAMRPGHRTNSGGSSPDATLVARGLIQNPSLTPGDVLTTDRNQICTHGYTKTVRNVPSSLKRQVYLEYGITGHKPGSYEIDHLISLELGGSNSMRNLWPESFVTKPLNAHIKDEVENKLHEMICSGAIGVMQAQQEIAGDWTAAYVRYVGPLPR